ncbi:MAG: transporter transrane region family protein [Micavibrio sp.]|nr:transporter transrane region family protein [Micavibrio sp.]
MSTKPKTHTPALVLIRRLTAAYLRPQMKTLVASLIFMILSGAMTAGFAALMKPIMDKVLVGQNTELILPFGIAILVCFVLNGIFGFAENVLMNKVGQNIIADVQYDMFSSFMSLDLAFFHANPSGQLMSRIINDVQVMRNAVADSLTGIGSSLITLIFLVAVMFHQDWKLALISFTVFPVAGICVSLLGRRLRSISGNIQHQIGALAGHLSQIFMGIRQVKAYGMEDFENRRAKESINSVRKLIMKSIRIGTMSTPINEALVGLALCGMITYGGYHIANGQGTVGSLISFITAFSLAYEPIKRLAKLNNTLQTGLGAAERVFEMMDMKPTILNKPDAKILQSSRPGIRFDNATFSYENAETQALNGVAFEIPPGKVTALVGPSGGGKSTIMNLIPRFYDVTAGSVRIDGTDLRDLTLESLRSHIALVSQDITIFDDNARANIAYGRAGATDEEITAAAIAAEADTFIRAMPEGYDTQLGENGVKLSGGQRQRIAIARAILRNAPILLLDEATSALDAESEQAIQKSFEKLQEGRTTLVIAHRLSTVQNADQIVVMDKGRVAESGTHAELLAKEGIYARLYMIGLKD